MGEVSRPLNFRLCRASLYLRWTVPL